MAKRVTLTPEQTVSRKREFIKAFAELGYALKACKAVGITPKQYEHWRKRDPNFREHVEIAKTGTVERLEIECDRRATEGVEKKLYNTGNAIYDPETGKHAVERTYSDALLMFRLKALKPDVYRENMRIDSHVHDERPLADRVADVLRLIPGGTVAIAARLSIPEPGREGAAGRPDRTDGDPE